MEKNKKNIRHDNVFILFLYPCIHELINLTLFHHARNFFLFPHSLSFSVFFSPSLSLPISFTHTCVVECCFCFFAVDVEGMVSAPNAA